MVHGRFAYLAALGVALAACGGSSTGGGSGTGTENSGAGGAHGGATGAGGAAATAPKAPVLEMVMPMAAVLHVEWSTPTTCDEIEAERKDPTHPYAVAFTIPGTKTSHMDSEASQDMDYTYRLRCKVGDVYSEYSNEKSANPTKKSQ